jgi:hypothetical protein
MEKNNKKTEPKKNPQNLFILLAVIIVTCYFTTRSHQTVAVEINCKPDRAKLVTIFTKATHIQNSSQMDIYADTCKVYLKHCPPEEMDTLKKFVPVYIQFTDVLSSAVIASVKDSGSFDTGAVMTPECVAAVKEMSDKCGIPYSQWTRNIFILASKAQIARNSMGDKGTDKRNTEFIRNGLTRLKNKNDSIVRVFSGKLFAEKN